MPRFSKLVPPFKAPKSFSFNWDNFRGGLNTLFRDQEIRDNELAQATNLMLVAQGVPTKRWGTAVYHLAGESGMVRGLKGFYPSGASGSNQLLAITDDGLLTARSNASYTIQTGVSWASGYPAEMAQLDNRMYIVNGQRELARYSNPTLVGFPTIAQPSALFATQISGISGTNTYSYMLTHTSSVGETSGYLASGAGNIYVLPNQPTDPSIGSTKVQWTNASTASGIRTGTNIYGRTLGYETFLAHVDGTATQWVDTGDSVPQLFSFGPKADSTGGPICGVVKKFQDRLVYSKFTADSTLVMISGRVPNHERFDFGSGGGFVRIEPDSGDDITAIETTEDKIVVFKERSIWSITLNQIQVGNFFLIEPVYKLITGSVGCASQRSVVRVENDIVFLARGGKGLYVLGYEPNILNVLRTNEISVKVRPYFQDLTPTQEMTAAATYFNYKYIITFPSKNECMVFDRERNAMVGPWTVDGSVLEVYSDPSDVIRLVMGDDDSTNVDEFSSSYPGDRGSAFTTTLRTKKDDMGDWTRFKNIQNVFTRWRNILGSVDVSIRTESRTGTTVTSSSFTVTPTTGNSGWGDNLWGNTMWGDSATAGISADQSETVRQSLLNDTARSIQITAQTDDLNDNYELLGVKTEAQDIGDYRPSSWRIAALPIPISMFINPMQSNMTGTAKSNEIFNGVISLIHVFMMNIQIFLFSTFLTFIVISLFYFISKNFWKSRFIMGKGITLSMFISWIKGAYSFLPKFLFRFFTQSTTSRSSGASTNHRTISSSSLIYSSLTSQKWFFAMKTIYFNFLNPSITKWAFSRFISTLRRTKLSSTLSNFSRKSLKTLTTPITNTINHIRRYYTNNLTISKEVI